MKVFDLMPLIPEQLQEKTDLILIITRKVFLFPFPSFLLDKRVKGLSIKRKKERFMEKMMPIKLT